MQGRDPACVVLALLKAEQQGYSGWPDPRSKRANTHTYLALLCGGKPQKIFPKEY